MSLVRLYNRGEAKNTARLLTIMLSKTQKAHYTETEAAEELGITVEQLRSLIRRHVVDREEDLQNVPVATFQPSDLLLLRFIAAARPQPQEV